MTSICKNVYIDQLGHIVGKYSNKHYSTIKMKCFDVKSTAVSKILNLKLVIAEEYQSTKVVFAKFYFPNWSKDMFVIKKITKHCVVAHVVSNLNGDICDISGTFDKKKLQKSN